MIRIFFLSQSSPILELFPFDKITLKSYICTVVTVMAKQCWSQTVLESGSWGHSVLQTPALVNRSFREGKFADIYKHSNVIPLPKKGDNSDPSNFRPVSLLSNVGKLQERIVFKHIYNFLHENDLLF